MLRQTQLVRKPTIRWFGGVVHRTGKAAPASFSMHPEASDQRRNGQALQREWPQGDLRPAYQSCDAVGVDVTSPYGFFSLTHDDLQGHWVA